METAVNVGDAAGSQIGAQRKVNDLFEETLLAVDEMNHTFSYSIDNAVGTPMARRGVPTQDPLTGWFGSAAMAVPRRL